MNTLATMASSAARKAIFAGFFSAASALGAILVGDMDFGDVTAGQWIAVVVAGLAGFQGTYWLKNEEVT